MAIDDQAGSYKSRKWAAFMLTSALVLVAGKITTPAAVDGVIFGLISAMGIYCGANVTRDWAAMKHGAAITPVPTPKTDAAKDAAGAQKVAAEAEKEEGS